MTVSMYIICYCTILSCNNASTTYEDHSLEGSPTDDDGVVKVT